MRIDETGLYKTRDGQRAQVSRIGQAIARGYVDGKIEEWARHNGKIELGFEPDNPLDIVDDWNA